jgi:hypothetical protein
LQSQRKGEINTKQKEARNKEQKKEERKRYYIKGNMEENEGKRLDILVGTGTSGWSAEHVTSRHATSRPFHCRSVETS